MIFSCKAGEDGGGQRSTPGHGRLEQSRLRGDGQEDAEARPLADLALDHDGSAVAAHDPENGGETEPAAGEFRGEEGVEDPLQGRLVTMPHPLSRTSSST